MLYLDINPYNPHKLLYLCVAEMFHFPSSVPVAEKSAVFPPIIITSAILIAEVVKMLPFPFISREYICVTHDMQLNHMGNLFSHAV